MADAGFPVVQFLLIALPGIGVGWALRWLLHRAWIKRDGQVENRYERFIYLLGTLTQSLAIGLSLSFLAALLTVDRFGDPRQWAGLTFLTAVVTAFIAAFLRELFRRISRMDF
jgi:putative flippase GtrA